MKSWFAPIAAGLAALALLAGGTGIARADVVVIDLEVNFFSPSDMTITTGDTVCWFWDHGVHTSTSADGLWDSGILSPGSMFEYTFNQAGDYPYFCSLHLDCCNMVGVIHVVDPVDLTGSLVATDADPNATGEVSYEKRPDRATLGVAVAGVTSTGMVDVFVNGSLIGTVVLDGSGSGELDLNTLNGDNVPDLQDGDEIEVYDAVDDTTLILIGNVSVGG